MQIVALAGGVGAGKFLRGVDRAFPGEPLTVVVNTGDDITIHGLHVSPDLDSVCYWLADLMDRERGWGRAGETFHAMEAMRASGRIDAWFNLGDRDLATHVLRTQLLHEGRTPLASHRRAVRDAVRPDDVGGPDDRRRGDHARSTCSIPRASRSTSTSRSTGCSDTRRTR